MPCAQRHISSVPVSENETRRVMLSWPAGRAALHPAAFALESLAAYASLPRMITIQETLLVDAEGHATVTLPPSVKPGIHTAVLHIEDETHPEAAAANHAALIGMWRGQVGFQQGWDAAIEDFGPYTE